MNTTKADAALTDVERIGGMRIAVTYGGYDDEWYLSRVSAQHIAEELEALGARPVLVCITAGGKGAPLPGENILLDARSPIPESVETLARARLDAAINLTQGQYALQARIWAVLRGAKLPVAGNPPSVQRMAWDKHSCKLLMQHAGVTTPNWAKLQPGADLPDFVKKLALQPPLIVKPLDGGSSKDVVLVQQSRELIAVCEELLLRNESLLVEEFIAGQEICAGAYGRWDASAFPLHLARVNHGRAFFDNSLKHTGDFTVDPAADLPSQAAETARQAALHMHRLLRCSCLSRMDFILSPRGLFALECNTAPGLAYASMTSKMIHFAGLRPGCVIAQCILEACAYEKQENRHSFPQLSV